MEERHRPGRIRDAIVSYLTSRKTPASVAEIRAAVARSLPDQRLAPSSVRSYLRLNTGTIFQRIGHGTYALHVSDVEDSYGTSPHESPGVPQAECAFVHRRTRMFSGDCRTWLAAQRENSVHAVVTDPPYGLVEYSPKEQAKLRAGKGGVWRIPPSFDGCKRSPLPRFTVLDEGDLTGITDFFNAWAKDIMRVIVPGAHVIVASNPLLSYRVSWALAQAGLERRGEIARLVMTMRGGDRPKNAHEEFPDVSVMPRSMWEPWLVYRKPLDGRVQDNLRRWKTGGFRRISKDQPFGDVVKSHPTRKDERALAPHPSLKPQSFLRQIVRAVLPLGEGVVLDPFAGSGSTLAAADNVGYEAIGIEIDQAYVQMARKAIPRLAQLVREADTPNLFAAS